MPNDDLPKSNDKNLQTTFERFPLSNGDYSGFAQISKDPHTDAYKGKNLLHFSIRNDVADKEAAFYSNGVLAFDTNDKNVLPAINELEQKIEKMNKDSLSWEQTKHDQIHGIKSDPLKPDHDIPVKWTTHSANHPEFALSQLSHPSLKQSPTTQMNDNFNKASSTQNRSPLDESIEKAKAEQKDRHTQRKHDRDKEREL